MAGKDSIATSLLWRSGAALKIMIKNGSSARPVCANSYQLNSNSCGCEVPIDITLRAEKAAQAHIDTNVGRANVHWRGWQFYHDRPADPRGWQGRKVRFCSA
ncbi:MAG: hypothetical protein ABIQ90_12405 [Polaromonas sp.]